MCNHRDTDTHYQAIFYDYLEKIFTRSSIFSYFLYTQNLFYDDYFNTIYLISVNILCNDISASYGAALNFTYN